MTDNEIRTLRISLQNLLDDYGLEFAKLRAAVETLMPEAQTVIDTGQEPVNQMVASITSDPSLAAGPPVPIPQPNPV